MPFERLGQVLIAQVTVRRQGREQIVIQRSETVEVELVRRGVLRAGVRWIVRVVVVVGGVGVRRGLTMVAALIEDVDFISKRAFLRLEIPRLRFLLVAVRPVVVETVPNALVDGRDGHHVRLAPLPAEIARLQFEQLQRVELHHRLLDAERLAKDGRGLDGDENLQSVRVRVQRGERR